MNSILTLYFGLVFGVFAFGPSAKAGVKVGCELTLTNMEILKALSFTADGHYFFTVISNRSNISTKKR